MKLPEFTPEECFSISGKGLKLNSEGDVAEYVKEIESKNIKSFVISGNTLGVAAATALAKALASKHDLTYVDLSDGFTGRLKDEVPSALREFNSAFQDKPKLEYLNISDNALGPPGVQAMASYLSVATSLKYLIMNNNGMGWFGGRTLSESLVQLAEECVRQTSNVLLSTETSTEEDESTRKGLRVFMSGRNRLENEGAIAISRGIAAHAKTLEQVCMPQNGIRGEGIKALCQSLGEANQLRVIDLQDNTFTLLGSMAFADVLPFWPQIRTMNLNDAYLTSKGAAHVFMALKNLSLQETNVLEHLLLQYNGIKEDEVMQLIQIVPHLKNLKSLQLNGNSFDPNSAIVDKLTETLDRCELTDILDSLSDMEFDEESEEDIESSEEDASSLSDVPSETSFITKEDQFEDLVKQMSSVHVESVNGEQNCSSIS